ncbi:MAG: transglutaminase family protein [Bacteroidota bacterium]
MEAQKKQLDEKQFNALITLLDDEDPEVSEHVWTRLSAMGQEGLDRLEAAWEVQEDPAMQARLEDAIAKLHLKEVGRELLDWRKGGGKDLLRGWYLVSRYQFPELEYQKYRNEVNRLVNKTWLELNGRMDANQKLRVVNHILFKMEGYGPNSSRPKFPNNSYLNYLIDQQEGNVMSLALLYLLICRQLDLPVYGVLLPGYFILMYKDERQEFFIDVYNGGKTFNKARLKGYLKQVNVEENASFFKPTSNIYIILRLLEQLAVDYDRNDKPEKAQEIAEILRDIEITF